MKFKASYKSGSLMLGGREYVVRDNVVDIPEEFAQKVMGLGYTTNESLKGFLFSPSLTKAVRKDKEKLDLAICLPHTITGGSEMRLLQTIRYLQDFRIHIMYIKDIKDGDVPGRFLEEPNVISCSYTRKAKIIRNRCFQHDVDILLFYGSDLPVLAFKDRIRPITILSLNTDTWEHSLRFAESCKRHLDAIITVSPHIVDIMKRKGFDVECILNGADHKRFYSVPKKENGGIIRIGYVGRLLRHKGPELLPEAMAGLKNVQLVIAGSKVTGLDGYNNIPRLCKKFKIPLKFHGLVKNTEEIYRKLDILVLMSDKEGMPMMVIEGALCRNAIISTRIGGLPQVFTHGENITFCKKDVGQLRAAIIDLINNPAKLERMKKGAYQFASKHLTMERVAKEYRAIFSKLVYKSSKVPQINIYRNGGGGDIIMSEPAVRKLRQIYPNAIMTYECGHEFRAVIKALGYTYKEIGMASTRVQFKYDKSYTKHAIAQYFSQIGGGFKNLEDNLPRMNVKCSRGIRNIGIHTTSDCVHKNWSRFNWERLIHMINDTYGYEVYQIDNGKTIIGATHIKSKDLGTYIKIVPTFKCVITVDTICSHIAAATRTPAIVLWGGGSSPRLTGYRSQKNIITPVKCRCWVSVRQTEYKRDDCPGGCINHIKPSVVFDAFVKERNEWIKKKN